MCFLSDTRFCCVALYWVSTHELGIEIKKCVRVFEKRVDMGLPIFISKMDSGQVCDVPALLSHAFVMKVVIGSLVGSAFLLWKDAPKIHNYAVLSHIERVRHFSRALFTIQNREYMVTSHIWPSPFNTMNLTVALKEQPTKLNSSNERVSFLTFLKNLVGTFFHQLRPRALIELSTYLHKTAILRRYFILLIYYILYA